MVRAWPFTNLLKTRHDEASRYATCSLFYDANYVFEALAIDLFDIFIDPTPGERHLRIRR